MTMPPPGNKASTPFKTMDIKTAFLSTGNRKRKATSPQICDSKAVKLSNENNDSDIEMIEEVCGATVTLEKELNSSLGDCKENKDINAAGTESSVTDCQENKDVKAVKSESCVTDREENKLTLSKDELPPTVIKESCNGLSSLQSKTEDNSDSDEQLSKKSKSDDSSSNELDNSVNVSLNTSGVSVTFEDDNEDKEITTSNSKSNECKDKEQRAPEDGVKQKSRKKKMTPAEAKKKAEERELRQKERMLKKQEKENRQRERLLEKERKIREKKLQKEREEEERKERERIKQEKKEQEEKEKQQRLKEREEKIKTKQMMLEFKLEEKKRREELKLKKEEELKKAEEEKLKLKLEKEQKEKEKKERAKAAFVKFFLKGESSTSAPPTQAIERGAFLPFQVSEDMILAPVVPPVAQERFDRKQFEYYLECQDEGKLYLEILKSGSYEDVKQRKKLRKLPASEADVILIDKKFQAELVLRPKLLKFCDNTRPAYWGTWRKKSKNIGPRRPFGQDEIFDYSVDSDEEWDEGGPGESLSGTDQEDVESEDEYEVDNEFFVPHGYLSDSEEKKDDDEEGNDPEKQKALLKLKLQQFEMERKKKTTELKPIILGCCFLAKSSSQDNELQLLLQEYSAELLTENPIPTNFTVRNQQTDSSNSKSESPKSSNSNSSKKKKLLLLPEEAFPQLIRLVHGNTKNRRNLAEEFQKYWIEQSGESHEMKESESEPSSNTEGALKIVGDEVPNDSAQISLRLLQQTIREIASYGKPPDSSFNKCCWWVHDSVREKYGLLDAPIPNQWKYVSQKEQEIPGKVNGASIKEFLSPN